MTDTTDSNAGDAGLPDDRIVIVLEPTDVVDRRGPHDGNDAPGARRGHRIRYAAAVAVTGLVTAGATTSLVGGTDGGPDSETVPVAISPSDATLGYLLSEAFPEVSIGEIGARDPLGNPLPSSDLRPSDTATPPSPADLTLGYLLSADVPDAVRDGRPSQIPAVHLSLSAATT
jgi:hypothetical protein